MVGWGGEGVGERKTNNCVTVHCRKAWVASLLCKIRSVVLKIKATTVETEKLYAVTFFVYASSRRKQAYKVLC